MFNAGKTVVDKAVYRLSTATSVPQIFAVKLESCLTSRQILDVFALPNFKRCTRVNTPAYSCTSCGKVSYRL